jgi:putative proteasome-type protease
VGAERRFEWDDPYYQSISTSWGESLRTALKALPDYEL